MTQLPAPPRTASAPTGPARKQGKVLPFVMIMAVLMVFAITRAGSPDRHGPFVGALLAGTGAILGLQAQALAGLLLGRLGGTAPTHLMVGTGRLLGTTRIGSVGISVRPIPLPVLQACTAVVAAPALRARLLLGGLVRVAVPAALGAALLYGTTGGPWGALGPGMLIIATLTLVAGPRNPGSVSWMLLRAPFADAALLPELALGPAELAAQRALFAGRIAEARTALDQVPADTTVRIRLHAALALAEGRYGQAVEELRGPQDQRALAPQLPGGELLLGRAGLFALEDGSVPREDAQAAARIGVSLGLERIPALLKATEVLATQALLEGRPKDALLLARRGLRRPTDLLTRAYTLCTLAGAQAATGDPTAARATLAQARALAPGLARVATVERLISELPSAGSPA